MNVTRYDPSLEQFKNVDRILRRFLPEPSDSPLADSMRYASLHGGKRIRAKLLMHCSKMGPVSSINLVHRLAASIEFLHAYSLVHDDLPAMDNDSVRRGDQSCHRRFGEDVAIMTGNSLMSLAFEVVGNLKFPAPDANSLSPTDVLSRYTSHDSVPTGQFLDLRSDQLELTLDEIVEAYELKTGELLGASIQFGCLASGLKRSTTQKLKEVGVRLGFTYQVLNDCHADRTTSEVSRAEGNKRKFSDSLIFSKLGKSESIEMALETIDEQRRLLNSMSLRTDPIELFTDYIKSRLQTHQKSKMNST